MLINRCIFSAEASQMKRDLRAIDQSKCNYFDAFEPWLFRSVIGCCGLGRDFRARFIDSLALLLQQRRTCTGWQLWAATR